VKGWLDNDGSKKKYERIRQQQLGGGWHIYFICSPLFGEMMKFDSYFSDELKPPTRQEETKTKKTMKKRNNEEEEQQ